MSMKLSELHYQTSRTPFNLTWLQEMPSGLGKFETWDTLDYSIKDFLKHGVDSTEVEPGILKLGTGDKIFYWCGTESDVKLAVELHEKPEGLVVSLLGKQNKLRGKGPYASDLYKAILKDSKKNIRIMSDIYLSDEGLALWKKLVKLGCKVSVYDKREPGKTFASFEKPEELDNFFRNDDADYTQYQYVLSEDILEFCKMRASFKTRQLRESVPGLLE